MLKVTEQKFEEVKKLLGTELSQREIAEMTDLGMSTVGFISQRKHLSYQEWMDWRRQYTKNHEAKYRKRKNPRGKNNAVTQDKFDTVHFLLDRKMKKGRIATLIGLSHTTVNRIASVNDFEAYRTLSNKIAREAFNSKTEPEAKPAEAKKADDLISALNNLTAAIVSLNQYIDNDRTRLEEEGLMDRLFRRNKI